MLETPSEANQASQLRASPSDREKMEERSIRSIGIASSWRREGGGEIKWTDNKNPALSAGKTLNLNYLTKTSEINDRTDRNRAWESQFLIGGRKGTERGSENPTFSSYSASSWARMASSLIWLSQSDENTSNDGTTRVGKSIILSPIAKLCHGHVHDPSPSRQSKQVWYESSHCFRIYERSRLSARVSAAEESCAKLVALFLRDGAK